MASAELTGGISITDAFGSALIADSGSGGNTEVTVRGSICLSGQYASGIEVYTQDGESETGVSVLGNITAVSTAAETDSGRASGIEMPYTFGKAKVSVAGSIEAESARSAEGIAIWTNTGAVDISVSGDVSATGSGESGNSVGINVRTCGGETTIDIGGDVSSNRIGIDVCSDTDEIKSVDIFIGGTLSVQEHAVVVRGDHIEDVLSLTVWKIDTDTENGIVSYRTPSDSVEDAQAHNETAGEIESGILYIIKNDLPENCGSLIIGGTVMSHGFPAAKAGDTIVLKPFTEQGYAISEAYYNGVALEQNESGDYTFTVPEGGGVLLSVVPEGCPEKIPDHSGNAGQIS
ncbi:MAG: hypothetical protein K6C08_09320 [Oscillospiraceae bacterium]|nr:hypothetical protein [Oscillospiraceae bacterium]